MEDIIAEIKKKKSLSNLEDDLIKELIREIPVNKKQFKRTLKETRNKLNIIYGQFWLDNKLSLESHKSTRERINLYPYLYKKIFEITGEPKTILDLGCGLNPLSYKYFNCKPKYIAVELTNEDCKKLNNWFKKNNIDGRAIRKDLRKDFLFPKSDICFMFKLLESLEEKGHKTAEKVINSVNCKWIVISFSSKTIRNRKMNFPRRGWLEMMLNRLNLSYSKFIEDNEIFYLVKKE